MKNPYLIEQITCVVLLGVALLAYARVLHTEYVDNPMIDEEFFITGYSYPAVPESPVISWDDLGLAESTSAEAKGPFLMARLSREIGYNIADARFQL